jgi:hypothetical protein
MPTKRKHVNTDERNTFRGVDRIRHRKMKSYPLFFFFKEKLRIAAVEFLPFKMRTPTKAAIFADT